MNDSDRRDDSRAWLAARFGREVDAGRDDDSGSDERPATIGSTDAAATAPPRAAVPTGGAAFVWGLKPRAYDDQPDDEHSDDERDDAVSGHDDIGDEAEVTAVPQPAPELPAEEQPAPESVQDEPPAPEPVQDEPQSSSGIQTLSEDFGSRRDASTADSPPILSMEEVLDAPSPRRAAREAEARAAEAREAEAHEAEAHEAASREAEAQAVADRSTAAEAFTDDGARRTDRVAPADGRENLVQNPPAPEHAEAGESAAADPEPVSPSPRPDGASGVDSLFDLSDGDDGREGRIGAGDHDGDGASEPGRAARATAAPLMDGPVSKWAETLRQASGRAESEAHEPPLASAPTGETTRRSVSGASMSATQKRLFWALALIIVVGLVLLVVLLTQQDDAASESARQLMSTSYGSDSMSSMTPLRISSGRNG